MKKFLLTIFCAIFCGFAFAGASQNGSTGWNLIKKGDASNSSITAMAEVGDNNSVIAGDSAGNIYIANTNDCLKAASTGLGQIDGIVNTIGNNYGLGDITFLAGGSIYTYKDSQSVLISDTLNNITCITYSSGLGLSCGTAQGEVYDYKYNSSTQTSSWEKMNDNQTAGHPIKSMCVYNNEVIAGTEDNGSVFAFDYTGGWKTTLINAPCQGISVNCLMSPHTDDLYCGLSNGVIYKYIDGNNWYDKGRLAENNVLYMGYLSDDNTVMASTENPVRTYYNGAWNPYFTAPYPVTGMAGPFIGTQDGSIYAMQPIEASKLQVHVSFVSGMENFNGPDTDAIYRVTIDGAGLDTNQIFNDGDNGFEYKLAAGNGDYVSYAYPVTGVQYRNDASSMASLNPKEVSFLWRGPKCSQKGDYQLHVSENVYSFKNSKEITDFAQKTIDLPAAEILPDLGLYSVRIRLDDSSAGSISNFSNGTCAIPFKVIISKGSQDLPSSDDIYNHLVFFTSDTDASAPDYNSLVGCNPFVNQYGGAGDSFDNIEHVIVLPYYCVETDGNVKYGNTPDSITRCLNNGRYYYYIQGQGGASTTLYASLKNNLDISVKTSPTEATASTTTCSFNPATGEIDLYEGGAQINVSNFDSFVEKDTQSGNIIPILSGYFDYIEIFQGESGFSGLHNGTYAVFPEGLNLTRGILSRLNFSKLEPGYYTQPVVSASINNELDANSYQLAGDPKYWKEASEYNSNIYAYLFDKNGSYGELAYNVPSYDDIDWESRDGDDCHLEIQLGNHSTLPVCMASLSPDLEGVPFYNINDTYASKGVFLPPNGLTATIGTTIKAQVDTDVSHSFYMITLGMPGMHTAFANLIKYNEERTDNAEFQSGPYPDKYSGYYNPCKTLVKYDFYYPNNTSHANLLYIGLFYGEAQTFVASYENLKGFVDGGTQVVYTVNGDGEINSKFDEDDDLKDHMNQNEYDNKYAPLPPQPYI